MKDNKKRANEFVESMVEVEQRTKPDLLLVIAGWEGEKEHYMETGVAKGSASVLAESLMSMAEHDKLLQTALSIIILRSKVVGIDPSKLKLAGVKMEMDRSEPH